MDKPRVTFTPLLLVVGLATLLGVIASGYGNPSALNTSMAVQIPMELKLALTAVLIGMLTAGFTYILNAVGLNLLAFAQPLSVTLSTFLVTLAQHWIDILPAQYDPSVQMFLNVLVVVVGGLGTLHILGRRNTM